MARRSASSNVTTDAPGVGTEGDDRVSIRMALASIVGPSLRMTARSITFCSSRTFPGQSYACSCRSAAGVTTSLPFRSLAAKCAAK